MTCTHYASFARGPVRASWLAEDIPCGPRSPRIRSRSEAVSGAVPITSSNLTPDGLRATEARQAFQEALLQARRLALITTARHLRNQMRTREASLATDELRAVTNAILAQGGR